MKHARDDRAGRTRFPVNADTTAVAGVGDVCANLDEKTLMAGSWLTPTP